jgi:hypothetical protein
MGNGQSGMVAMKLAGDPQKPIKPHERSENCVRRIVANTWWIV